MLDERHTDEGIFSTGSVVASFVLHVAVFALIALIAGVANRPPKEEDVKIMDITVVLHENLDKPPDDLKPDDKPKPPDPPPPKPPQPKPPPKPPDPPKPDPKVDAVEKIVEKPEKKPEKKPTKKPFQKGERVENKTPPAPPKPREFTKGQRVVANGPRTEKKLSPEEIRRMLLMGAREGTKNQMPDNELSLYYSLLQRRFYDRWDQPAWSPNLRRAVLHVQFDRGGRVTGYKLVESSGDPQVDSSIRAAAARVQFVPGLSADFLRTHSIVPIAFEVTAE